MGRAGRELSGVFQRAAYVLQMALCFVIFGVGALILSLVCVSTWLLPLGRSNRARCCRRLISGGFRFLVVWINFTGIATIRFEGLERLRSDLNEVPCVVIANHPSLIDVVVLLAYLPEANCVVKSALWRNPFMALVVRSCNYIPNNGGAQVMHNCERAINAGESLIIFPEGSRTTSGQPSKLNRGAANVALKTNGFVARVEIESPHPFLTKELSWYRIPKSLPVLILRYRGRDDWHRRTSGERSRVAREMTAEWSRIFNQGHNNERSIKERNKAANH